MGLGTLRWTLQDVNPMVEPTFDQENSPWNARGAGLGEGQPRWSIMTPTSPVKVQREVIHPANLDHLLLQFLHIQTS